MGSREETLLVLESPNLEIPSGVLSRDLLLNERPRANGVETVEIDVQLALQQARAAELERDRRQVYVSDPISRRRMESFRDRLRRVRFEVQEMESMLVNEQERGGLLGVNIEYSSEELAKLESRIETIQSVLVDSELGSTNVPVSRYRSVDAVSAALEEEIHSWSKQDRSVDIQSKHIQNSPSGDSNGLTYQIYVDAVESEMDRSRSISVLENRLAAIESAIGVHSLSDNENNCASLSRRLYEVESLVSILDEARLQEIGKRAHEVNLELENLLQSRKSMIEMSTGLISMDDSKVFDVFQTVEKWRAFADDIPLLIDRLYTLKDVHNRSRATVDRAHRLVTENETLKSRVDELETVLSQLESSFQENTKIFQENLAQLVSGRSLSST